MENIIQHQIRLVTFKAVKVELTCGKLPPDFKPSFDLKLSDLMLPDSPHLFAKVFNIAMQTPSFGTEIIHCNVEYHTVFECNSPVDDKFLKSEFGRISAPAIGFPFVRAFISTISLQAGLAPIIIPSINFVQFSKEMEANTAEISKYKS
jgi:preprotein translocase subunit SecB